ncbi:MAG: Non-canonical purine NTP pyrophosphatase [Candidatus Curtissbacteria bacterium GW2011_GWC1_44_33]|uniref:Non-canonical purine NTP pyrophosphatase n=2 Tax=Microgenomates group TaxID=1794810 RepID=A0A0G1J4V6_9BACT|nr:MAG: Non-canonical purine NTP pyrophosphatase [Candidatus Curtissbacteria bacterium GW2011_GWC1_44_33]
MIWGYERSSQALLMKIKRLVIGSTNPAKINEWKKLLRGFPVISLAELGNFPEPHESGKTFGENARLKASHYAKLTGEFVLSDDGGYEVDALGGLPGVNSRRILPGGKDGTDADLINFVLEKLKGIPSKKRTVSLSFVAAVSDPKGNVIFEDKNSFVGIVTKKPGPVKIEGYPFRTIHFIPKLGKTYAQLNEEEHEKYNHKAPVARRLKKFLLEYK